MSDGPSQKVVGVDPSAGNIFTYEICVKVNLHYIALEICIYVYVYHLSPVYLSHMCTKSE